MCGLSWYQSPSFSPACGGFPIDVGKAGKVLHVLVLRIPACCQGRVHVTGIPVSRGVHGGACVAGVGSWDLWPARSHWRGMQPGSTAHQTGLHS